MTCRRELNILRVFILISWIVIPFLALMSRIEVDYFAFKTLFLIVAACYSFALISYWRKLKFFGECLELLGSGFLFIIPILVSTYIAMTLDFPLADAELINMDQALGFKWFWFISFVDSSEFLSWLLLEAYTSFGIQLMLIPIILVLVGDAKRACAYIFGYSLLCFISSVIAIWYPALGTYTLYGVTQADLTNINAHFGFFFLDDFNSIRSGEPFVLTVSKASGIVTFPSVHAGVAFLTLWAAWKNKWIRWPFFILNILMATSAISHANHYLIDVIAGFGIAGITVTIVSYLFLGDRFFWQSANVAHKDVLPNN